MLCHSSQYFRSIAHTCHLRSPKSIGGCSSRVPIMKTFARFSFCEESFRLTVVIATAPRTLVSFHGSLISA
jgi:hypothetical protein